MEITAEQRKQIAFNLAKKVHYIDVDGGRYLPDDITECNSWEFDSWCDTVDEFLAALESVL